MEKLKIGIVGLGSIGIRHLKNISEILTEKQVAYSIDVIRSGKGKAIHSEIRSLIDGVLTEKDALKKQYDILFITNPTDKHYATIKTYATTTTHMFIEKPVFDQTDLDIQTLGLKASGVYYVACPLRYTGVIEYLKQKVDLKNVYSIRIICSSYLPEWRPETDYRHTYSAHKAQGGGVSIDLIHEWDYLYYLLGEPQKVLNLRGTYSDLEIDSDDLSVYIAQYQSSLAEIHLDYFGRESIRQIELFTKEETIVGDLIQHQIRFLKQEKIMDFSKNRDDYQKKELETFLEMVAGKEKNHNTIQTALKVLKIAKGEAQ